MRLRTLLLVALAIILAGGTAMLARSWLAAQRTREIAEVVPPVPVKPATSVLVARSSISRGQILRPEDLTWQVWPDGGIDKNYIVQGGSQKPETYAGWVALNPIGSGEPVTEAKIISPGNRGFLAAVLHPGMRAISVPVTVTSGISGFVFPGDQVDLLLTYPVPAPVAQEGVKISSYEHKAAETVLQNIRVVAIDQRLDTKQGEAMVAHTATFEVTPKQSEVIALASEIGKVSLTLRSLAQTPHEGSSSESAVADTSGSTPADSAVAGSATYTLDSEISPLLPKVSGSKDVAEGTIVTILRGSQKASEFRVPEPASKGL